MTARVNPDRIRLNSSTPGRRLGRAFFGLLKGSLVALVIAVSTAIGLARLRIGPRIEALDGKLSAMTFEIFAGIALPRAVVGWVEGQ